MHKVKYGDGMLLKL